MCCAEHDTEASVLGLASRILEAAAAQHESLESDVFGLLSDAKEYGMASPPENRSRGKVPILRSKSIPLGYGKAILLGG